MSKVSKSAKPVTAAPQRKAAARKTANKAPVAASGRTAPPYHHGDLHGALLKAAQVVLERDGIAGLTLRAVARETGVSHAAPTHHFGDLTGLLSELAAVGFRNFDAVMTAAGAAGSTPIESALARARAYLAYAREQPGMYQLMFRTERLDMNRPALKEASNASFAGLASVTGVVHDGDVTKDALTVEQASRIARTWSLSHGFAMLTIEGRLNDILRRMPGHPDAAELFIEMLKMTLAPPK